MLMPRSTAERGSLGPVVEDFGRATMPHAVVALAVIVSAVLLFGSLRRGSLAIAHGWAFALGLAVLVLAAGAHVWWRRRAPRVVLCERGVVVATPFRERAIAWDQTENIVATYTIIGRSESRGTPAHSVVLTVVDADPVKLTMASCRHPTRMMRALEAALVPHLGAQLAAHLAGGGVLARGTLHLVNGGWMVLGNLIPWSSLRRVGRSGDRVFVEFETIGRYELGSYGELSAAWPTLCFAVEQARRHGGEATIFTDLPVKLLTA